MKLKIRQRILSFYHFFARRHKKKSLLVFSVLVIWYWFALPDPLFSDPTSMVLEDRDGRLLGAKIATDGQWRFPKNTLVPEKFAKAILEFEDRRFYYHPGIDPLSICRAMIQNIREKQVVSGGSTLTMQVIRLSRKGKHRSVFQKFSEAVLATRLELRCSKREILALYSAHAPFGGNVVGLDAATWRYYGKSPDMLSWAEAATLAVLPNSPALIHPGRNRDALKAKRDRLLTNLHKKGIIDDWTWELSLEESLPKEPTPLPRHAPHLLDRAFAEHVRAKKTKETKVKTTLRVELQKDVNDIINLHHKRLMANGIYNLAAVIIDVKTGDVIAYTGNVPDHPEGDHGHNVDIIKSPRSTGSIIKPLLYGMMMHEGQLLPSNLVQDIPTYIDGYRPINFYDEYSGMVSAQNALASSLNVPAVRLLQDYGVEKFHFEIRKMGLTTINRPPNDYGLTLILGGAETSLWDITNVYACMSRTLNKFYVQSGRYDPASFRTANYVFGAESEKVPEKKWLKEAPRMSAAAIWQTFQAMEEVVRPGSEGAWEEYRSSRRIAWKTGTSFGYRDAWAIGVTPEYAVGVWAGNADGEGRPELIGVKAAAPVLFALFDELPETSWWDQPYDEMSRQAVCRKSGFRLSPHCEESDTIWIANAGLRSRTCSYHKLIHLDPTENWQVSMDCQGPDQMITKPWFILAPVEEYYFKSRHPGYKSLPPFKEGCSGETMADGDAMEFIYPKPGARIYVPKDLDGNNSRAVFRAAHRSRQSVIYWHLDNAYLGSTSDFHEFQLNPTPGRHLLTIVDNSGNRLEQSFEVLEP